MITDLAKLETLPRFEPIKTRAVKRVKSRKGLKSAAEMNDWASAVWQYLVDHSRPTSEGYAISFVAQSKDNFFHRVEARKNGEFKREDIGRMERKVAKAKRKDVYLERKAAARKNAETIAPLWFRILLKAQSRLKKFCDTYTWNHYSV